LDEMWVTEGHVTSNVWVNTTAEMKYDICLLSKPQVRN